MKTEFTLDEICELVDCDTREDGLCRYYPASLELAAHINRLKEEVQNGGLTPNIKGMLGEFFVLYNYDCYPYDADYGFPDFKINDEEYLEVKTGKEARYEVSQRIAFRWLVNQGYKITVIKLDIDVVENHVLIFNPREWEFRG